MLPGADRVNETATFTSAVKGETNIVNQRFDCNERCLVCLLTCNKCKMHYVEQTVDQFRSRWNNYKNDCRKHGQVCNDICQFIFVPLAIVVS